MSAVRALLQRLSEAIPEDAPDDGYHQFGANRVTFGAVRAASREWHAVTAPPPRSQTEVERWASDLFGRQP